MTRNLTPNHQDQHLLCLSCFVLCLAFSKLGLTVPVHGALKKKKVDQVGFEQFSIFQ